jgi:RNA-directed DNA polymerase
MEVKDKAKQFLNCTDPREMSYVLDIKLNSLLFFAYGNRKLYTEFEIDKKSGGKRKIETPIEGLKYTQNKIVEILKEIYNSPKQNHGFVNGKSPISNANTHISKKLVFNIDLEDFFGSIHSGRILGLFKSYPFKFDNKISSLLTGILTYNNHLPQGAPSSPILSNMISLKLDKQLTELAYKNKCIYTRYADDITFSTHLSEFDKSILYRKSEFIFIGEELERIVQDNCFKINNKKTRVYPKNTSQWVTGIKVNKKANVSRKYIRRIRAMLHSWEIEGYGIAENRYNNKNNSNKKKKFLEVVRGKIDFLGQVKGRGDNIYVNFYNKFVELENKGRSKIKNKLEILGLKALVVKSSTQQGSGFIIGDKLITCSHVIGNDEIIEFWKHDLDTVSEKKKARVLYNDRIKDIAVLELCYPLTGYKSEMSNRRDSDISTGDECIVFGYSDYNIGFGPNLTSSKINSKSRNRNNFHDFRISDGMWKGMSGGPVFDDNEKVIGMARFGSSTLEESHATANHLFLGPDDIREAIEESKNTT